MSEDQENYRVLARKYRPLGFDQLVGQDALVRTLKNAIESGRIAHAFMLTGIRGIGKTTTARIIAKALNYAGPDGKAAATTGATDDCEICKAIAEDRHPDVIEMDAASRTGVEDIREILDGVRYAPTSARYKIYIIDEVHMLSRQAFNALLKTLEEPPPHVKFIFATTEIRKVPVTVLSRCQRFDLRRVNEEELLKHFKMICDKENVTAIDDALAMIARAADGSVRDGLSLLDQAIALGNADISTALVRDMLGLADRSRGFDLFEKAVKGQTPEALDIIEDMHNNGGDPAVIIKDLLDVCHLLTKLHVVPDAKNLKTGMSDNEQQRALTLAKSLTMPSLGRAWQILLKGISEVNIAPSPQNAAEMVIIRLSYAADLPDPATLIKKLKKMEASGAVGLSSPASAGGPHGSGTSASTSAFTGVTGTTTQLAVHTQAVPVANANLETLQDIVALLEQNGSVMLSAQVFQYVRLISIKAGKKLEIALAEGAPKTLLQDLTKKLRSVTDQKWVVMLSATQGALTLAEQEEAQQQAELDKIKAHPLMKKALEAFPDAEIVRLV